MKNAEPFLRECIDSITSQTEINWELIAVDDSSTDSSFRILKEYEGYDSRIKPLKTNGSGIIDALRLAYSKSSGHFITRMDADDKMTPFKLENLKRNLISFKKGSIATGKVKYFSEGRLGEGYERYERWLNELTDSGNNYQDIYKECVIPSPCWMVHREDFEKCGAFEPNTYPEDYDLCFRFYRERLNVIPCNEVLHHWRDHSTRTSRNDEKYADNRFLELKLNWFLQLDFDNTKQLILWGAGKKGKTIARLLGENRIPFRWTCNNPNKIGHKVHGVNLESVQVLHDLASSQVIVAVANQQEQKKIASQLDKEAYWFC